MSSREFYDPYYDEWMMTQYPGYSVSKQGYVWGPGRYGNPGILTPWANPRSGHLMVSLYVDGNRYKEYVHRLVAEAFIPNPEGYPLVRHLDDDPSNNSVENLAWGTQLDNVHDAIEHGRFRYFSDEDREFAMQKRRTPIRAINFATGEELYFESQQEAARVLNIGQSCIWKVMNGKANSAGGYYFTYADNEEPIDISTKKFSRHGAFIRATNINTGEELIFRGQTEAARVLGMSIASVSSILSGKYDHLKGYTFEYVDEERGDYDD